MVYAGLDALSHAVEDPLGIRPVLLTDALAYDA